MSVAAMAMETFAEAWVAASSHHAPPLHDPPPPANIPVCRSGVPCRIPPNGNTSVRAPSFPPISHLGPGIQQTALVRHPNSYFHHLPSSSERQQQEASASSVEVSEGEPGEISHPTYRLLGSKLPSSQIPPPSPAHVFLSGTNKDSRLATSPHNQPTAPAKSIPIHCTVEHSPGKGIELDSYAIIPSSVLFADLVKTALLKLGYSSTEALGAKGRICLQHWKPLSLEQVTEEPFVTVGEVLGEISLAITLAIQLFSADATLPNEPSEWNDETVRTAVLLLLREVSQSKLAAMCPLSQPLLSALINNKYHGKVGKEKCREFGAWYLEFRQDCPLGDASMPPERPPPEGRLTFHPTQELPLLREWYRASANPTARALANYAHILNSSGLRQHERPIVTIQALKNWWKNERQRERRIQKQGGLSNGQPLFHRRKNRKLTTNSREIIAIISTPDVAV